MKEMKKVLAVLVAILLVSSVLYAGPVHVNNTNPKAPATDGAIWGGKLPPPKEGAIWGGNSTGINAPHGNPSAQGAYHQNLVELIKSIGRGLGLIIEGAIWG